MIVLEIVLLKSSDTDFAEDADDETLIDDTLIVHTNRIERIWREVKRGLRGQRCVCPKHQHQRRDVPLQLPQGNNMFLGTQEDHPLRPGKTPVKGRGAEERIVFDLSWPRGQLNRCFGFFIKLGRIENETIKRGETNCQSFVTEPRGGPNERSLRSNQIFE